MKRSALLAVTAVTLVMALGACTNKTDGIANPSTTSTSKGNGPFSNTSSPSTSTSDSPSDAPSPTKNLQPCSLLTPSEVTSLQLVGGTESELTYSRGCDYHYSSNTYSFGTVIYDALGLKDIQGRNQLKQTTVGSREAVQGVSGATCVIAMKVTDTSRVETSAAANGDIDKACSLAMAGAQLVEPKLPK